ncbi:MAG: NADH-quinone oxidoreductase subunit N [Prevotella sp.]|nr:NADH-quinone oxidoreductase subunit N [Prevotella sp.]MDY4151046.1 NADH-quinone oxidoreductase subunit N [Prevotella sp.]
MQIDYSQFLNMIPEVSLVLLMVIVFVADFITANKRYRGWLNTLVCALLLAHVAFTISVGVSDSAFGGMYHTTPSISVIKSILTFGTLIVCLQAKEWLNDENRSKFQGEFYLLVLSTLLGMNVMVSANHFLLFFLGLEMASVPMACLVAFDKWKNECAEAGAKFILTATFSSGVMIYGLSMLYGALGNLYFDNVANNITATPLTIAGLVFFFSGLAFKLSLVPFHFWTADTYQGAPSVVAGYLSVISKGAAAFAALTILTKVFANIITFWHPMLCIIIVLSITVANLFAIRQENIKRFMAFSSISQAGYIMLALLSPSAYATTALSYYVLIYIVANLAVFGIIAVIENHDAKAVNISDYDGLYKTNPHLSFLMTLALFSLGGIPPFAGMFSKFFIFMASLNDYTIDTTMGIVTYVVVFIALVNTVISLYYYLLIVKAMYIKPSEKPIAKFVSKPETKLALALCTLGVVLFGIVSGVYTWIYAAALY